MDWSHASDAAGAGGSPIRQAGRDLLQANDERVEVLTCRSPRRLHGAGSMLPAMDQHAKVVARVATHDAPTLFEKLQELHLMVVDMLPERRHARDHDRHFPSFQREEDRPWTSVRDNHPRLLRELLQLISLEERLAPCVLGRRTVAVLDDDGFFAGLSERVCHVHEPVEWRFMRSRHDQDQNSSPTSSALG